MTDCSISIEQTSFSRCPDTNSQIHNESCYVMFKQNQSGIAKIIRALKNFHSPESLKEKHESAFEAGFVESFVGEPHLICECLERLQYLRFQLVCTMEFKFITSIGEQTN